MDTRREFLQKAAALAGATGLWSVLPASIANALAIDPEQGSTYLDAEHIVILMQENRSFDHALGSLKGVRGFNDPRALRLANRNPVWLQTNADGETYAPFRLNIKETNATWMGSLPHSFTDQVDARNNGLYDKWLQAKPSGHREYSKMPLTMGHYNREDIPFYYSLADAFTVCDQHFCSSLTGTMPNRLYHWSGTIREKKDASVFANVRNEDVDFGREVKWKTFPERLEENGISWKVYQNELTLDTGLTEDEDYWLSNFEDNPLEWFDQYQVRYSTGHTGYLERMLKNLPVEIEELKTKISDLPAGREDVQKLKRELQDKTTQLTRAKTGIRKWNLESFKALSARERSIHERAFCTNSSDPDYRKLTMLTYKDGDVERKVQIPKGDIFHQFRQDVKTGKLPTVSWLVAPTAFSDHPGSAWYGAWYVSEALDILTQNPEVWKKTIFILNYDENDGYFDHYPPFVAPHPKKPETGKVSEGIDTSIEYVELEQDKKRTEVGKARESSIGLGYRVPLIIASPWSRGGAVCSEVFDLTSPLRLMEKWLTHKTGKKIVESNITDWRRTVCGDLTSCFKPYMGEKIETPAFPTRDSVIEGIHKAQFKKPPTEHRGLTAEEIAQAKADPNSPLLPKQEPGIRPSAPLPYELYVEGGMNGDRSGISLRMAAANNVFGSNASGSPFNAYAYLGQSKMEARSYAVKAGDLLEDIWETSAFENGIYHLRVDGPNGFYREFRGNVGDPKLVVSVTYAGGKSPTGGVEVMVVNQEGRSQTVEVADLSYKSGKKSLTVSGNGKASVIVTTAKSHGWYDFSVKVPGFTNFGKRYAGRVETGKWSYSDPAMGKTI